MRSSTITSKTTDAQPLHVERLRISIRGVVQGVGFRPFTHHLARKHRLLGFVNNSNRGVEIEVEGERPALECFLEDVARTKPILAQIYSMESAYLDPVGYVSFEIRKSEATTSASTDILPDVATCKACLEDIRDPDNRRYRYPFTNCTHCGPRYSIIHALPYDRINTSMRAFEMCDACTEEYHNPYDRRFHAQPTACPDCGPQLSLTDARGTVLERKDEALAGVVHALQDGKIVAVKGLGGFHLVVDATQAEAIDRLRDRKHRDEKPFALMYPTLRLAQDHCKISTKEERLLRSPQTPIVLLRRKDDCPLPANIAPNSPYLGIMLPYTPLHHLLLAELGRPVIATSGNLSDEPICIEDQDALEHLGRIADVFLMHDRPIVRQVDDSIVRIVADREMVLRRARGYAPLPIPCKPCAQSVCAVGAHMKNTVALGRPGGIYISQHIGDLDNFASYQRFTRVAEDLRTLLEIAPDRYAADMHPDYRSTQYALQQSPEVLGVQHHHAHVAACMGENELTGNVLGVAWDGTGYGTDGTIWGGEFLIASESSFVRLAHLKPFVLPGGEAAVKEPRRVAIALLHAAYGEDVSTLEQLEPLRSFEYSQVDALLTMIRKGINSPITTSMGRLFDGVSAIVGLRQKNAFEGQAAIELECIADTTDLEASYPVYASTNDGSTIVLDWIPMVRAIVRDVLDRRPASTISAKFHRALAESVVTVAHFAQLKRVVLSGGCFQNKFLSELTIRRLREEGFSPYWHQRIPPNDGGIAAGQAIIAAAQAKDD